MRCPKCHAEIEEGYLYCKNCGEEIRIVPDYDPQVEDMLSGSLKDVVKEAQQNASEESGRRAVCRPDRAGRRPPPMPGHPLPEKQKGLPEQRETAENAILGNGV